MFFPTVSGDRHAPLIEQPLDFFDDGSPYLDHPLLTTARTKAEIDQIVARLDLVPGAKVLDVGCGSGRHTIELKRRGFEATGIDPSAAMIAAATNRAAEAGVDVVLEQTAGEELIAEREFDGAICLFTTLGQVGAAGDNTRLLGRVRAALRPGAKLAVEVPQRDAAVQMLVEREEFGEGEHRTVVTREFDDASGTVTEQFRVAVGALERSYRLRYRLFACEQLTALLEAAGFVDVSVTAGYTGEALVPESPVMLAIARASAPARQ